MSLPQSDKMFAGVPPELFRVHDWRNDVKTLGSVPKEFVGEITDGKYSHEYLVQLNKLVVDGGHDLIISVGQVCRTVASASCATVHVRAYLAVGGSPRSRWHGQPQQKYVGARVHAYVGLPPRILKLSSNAGNRSDAAGKKRSTRVTLLALSTGWRI